MGIVVVIGNELFGCADDGKMNPHAGKARLKAVGEKRVGDVFAVPSQEEIHSVNSRSREMRGVASRERRKNPALDQFGGESLDLLVEFEQVQPGEQLKSFGGLGGLALGGLLQYKLRCEEVELLPLTVPPLSGKFLSSELQKVSGWARDVIAGNGGFDEDRLRHGGVLLASSALCKREWPNDPKLSDRDLGARVTAQRRKVKARRMLGFMAGAYAVTEPVEPPAAHRKLNARVAVRCSAYGLGVDPANWVEPPRRARCKSKARVAVPKGRAVTMRTNSRTFDNLSPRREGRG